MSGKTGLMKLAAPMVKITRNGLRFLSKNSNSILTFLSVCGVTLTAYEAVRGTIKAVKLCEEKKVVGRKEVLKTVWKCYIPTGAVLILTTVTILCNGKINAKRLAVVTGAYTSSVETIKKIEETMSEQIGPKKTQQAVDEAESALAKERIPQNKGEIIATGQGNQLFFCATTGQWFRSDRNGVELAEMKMQKRFEKLKSSWGVREVFLVSEAQEALGLPETDMGSYMGWLTDDFLDEPDSTIHFTISSDWMDLPWGKEVVGIVRFTPWPINI